MTEDLIKLLTIEFPGELNPEQTESLLGYIAREVPANVHYNLARFGTFFHNPQDGTLSKENGTVKITGNIGTLGTPFACDAFDSIHSEDNCGFIKGIRFAQIPDYELRDYSSEFVRLWRDVREKVYAFFEPATSTSTTPANIDVNMTSRVLE